MTQNTQILQHLKRRPITPLEAIHLYGCLRLGARIWDLRRQGYKIKADKISVMTRTGETYVARYSLA